MYPTTVKCIRTVIFAVLLVATTCEIPSYIHVCQRNNPDLSDCITSSINALIPYLKVGIPELGVPPLEPLQWNHAQLKLGSNDARIATNLSDIHIWGASLFELLNLRSYEKEPGIVKVSADVVPNTLVFGRHAYDATFLSKSVEAFYCNLVIHYRYIHRVNISSNTFCFNVVIPTLRLEGRYEVDTKILFVNVKGKGPFTINVNDYQFNCTLKGHQIDKNSGSYLKFEKMNCNMDFRDANIHLDNLFNGNVLLGNATNGAINNNVDLFFHEIKPNLTNTLEETFTDISNNISLRFTYEELFP